jgi:multidrug efflux pump subunit AcrA (membrane-fusion protein)
VALAQIQFQAAQDALADARAAVQRAQDNVQLAADRAKNDQDQAAADAAGGVETAQAALRSAQRRLQENESKLAQAKLLWNETRAQQEIAALQLRVSKDQQDVQDTAALLKNAKDAASAAAASTLAAQARRSLQVDQLALDQANSNLGAAKLTDQADIKAAQIAYDQANDDLATAQVALQRAQDKAARVARDPGTPRPSVNGVGEPTDPETLQARVRDAEHRVEAERINLDDAQAARANVDVQAPDARDPRDTRTPVGSLSLDAAKAQLDADSARVAELQQGASGDEVRRQETRVNLLKDQASQAAAAAQPVVVLKAPFDATVTDVGVTDGQTVIPQAGATDVSTSPTASGSVAGQTGDGRQVAVRLAGAGVTSIVANVAETDVNQLSVGQDVSLTFPGLPGQDGSGTIAEIAAAPTVTGTNVSYPVRVDVPNAPPQLKVGMSVQLNAEVDEARDVLLVPLDAIRNVSGQALVGKIDSSSGVVQDVPVNVGRTAGLTAELTSGVNEGDVVALYTQATAAAVR